MSFAASRQRMTAFKTIPIAAAAILSGCVKPIPEMPEGRLDASECGYESSYAAVREARSTLDQAVTAGASDAAIRRHRSLLESVERRLADAASCEERARNWSDLSAQWANARAAANVARYASAQANLTIIEIFALLGTIGVGIWAIIESRRATTKTLAAAQAQFATQRRPWLSVKVDDVVHDPNGAFVLRLTVKNVGLGVATNFNVVAPADPWMRPNRQWLAANLNYLREQIETASHTPFHVGMTLFPDQEHHEDVVVNYAGFDTQYVAGYVRYYSPADDNPETVHITPFLWMVDVDSDEFGPQGATAAPFIANIEPT